MTDTRRDRIAAVVVTYSRKELLGQCLDALLMQTCPLDAIYIVDNCSTDGTYEYLLGRDLISPAVDPADGPCETVKAVVARAFPGRRLAVLHREDHEPHARPLSRPERGDHVGGVVGVHPRPADAAR